MFSLLGVCLFRCGKRVLSYFVAALSLLTYESGFLVFFFAELLATRDTVNIRRNMRHFLCCGVIIACILAYKVFITNDDYVAGVAAGVGANFPKMMKKFAGGMILGPLFSGLAVVRGVLLGLNTGALWAVVVACCLCVGRFFFLRVRNHEESKACSFFGSTEASQVTVGIFQYNRALRPDGYFLLAALLFLPCAYLLSITHYPPTSLVGRSTSVHLAASVAWALVLGAAASVLWNRGMHKTVCALCFIMLFGAYQYAGVMQRAYVRVAKEEVAVFDEIERLCPDMWGADGIIVDSSFERRPDIKAMQVLHWALPIAAELRWGKKQDGTPPVPLYRPLTTPVQFRDNNGQIEFFNDGLPQWGAWLPVTDKTIFLTQTAARGSLRRVFAVEYAEVGARKQRREHSIHFKRNRNISGIMPEAGTP
jgi:hypothetical protein